MKKHRSRNLKKQYDLGKFASLYKTNFLTGLKQNPNRGDRFSPINIDEAGISFWVAKSFGFCKGVENAIEVAYETLAKNPGKRVFMISELIHNSFVNKDLKDRGLTFLKTSTGKQLVPWSEVQAGDIVITPAFGATLEDQKIAEDLGVDLSPYNATCRFVENVWFRAEELGKKGFTIVIHGKFQHEETQATFSHSDIQAPTVVVLNMEEAKMLAEIVQGRRPLEQFEQFFRHKSSAHFDPKLHLERLAVVNQTTMLATETAAITDLLRAAVRKKHGEAQLDEYFGNTRDTLCYATKNNQEATLRLLEKQADFAIIIGGKNSSNTSHLVELCEQKLPTYFIQSSEDILSPTELIHWDYAQKASQRIQDYMPFNKKPHILITSGASCPDSLVEEVIEKLKGYAAIGAGKAQRVRT